MADKPQAQRNDLGHLFVDIGINGLGKTLKGLNSVAASFLLGKNAATQFAQTLTQPFKDAGNNAVQIGKMSNALATSSDEFQRLSMYLKKFNLSDELLGDVNKLETTLYDLSQGFSNIPASMAVALQQTGLNIMEYNGTFESTMKLIDDLQKATSGMSKEKRNQILRQFGISVDWGYLWDKGGRAGDYVTISKEAIKKNQELAESLESLKNTTTVVWQETLSKIAPSLKIIADNLNSWMVNFKEDGGINKSFNATKGVVQEIAPSNWWERGLNSLPVIAIPKMIYGGYTGYNEPNTPKNNNSNLPPLETIKDESLTGGAAEVNQGYLGELPDLTPPSVKENAGLPPNISNMVQNITNNITHDITINGNNAQEIADRIVGISEQDIQYTQYQAANLAGL